MIYSSFQQLEYILKKPKSVDSKFDLNPGCRMVVQVGWSDPEKTSNNISHQKIGISRVHLHPLLIQRICSVKLLNSATNKGVQLLEQVIPFCPNTELSSPAGHSRPGHRGHKFPHTWKEELGLFNISRDLW